MDAVEAWSMIISKLKENQMEFPTVPKTKKIPVWFLASTTGDIIYIDKAIHHQPSSQISTPRKLNYKVFKNIYPLYLRRENGDSISKEASAITVNQVYYFSLIKHLCNI